MQSLTKLSKSIFFMDLDSIFDTRLGLLSIMFPNLATAVVHDKSYFNRTSDKFEFDGVVITHDFIKPYYDRRNKNLLKCSGITLIPYIIANEVVRHKTTIDNGECLDPCKIFINTYPYKLLDEEKNNVKTVFYQYLNEEIDFEFVYMHNKDITVDFIKDTGIDLILKYDGLSWIESLDKKKLLGCPIKDTTICVPNIINTYGKNTGDLKKDFLDILRDSLSLMIDFEFVDSYIFSDSRFLVKKE